MSSPDEPRRHAAWRVAAVVLGLVVLAGIAVGVLSIAGDDGDAEPAAPSASAPSEVPDIGGLVVEGTGYTVQVPEGWTDGTDDFVATNPGLSTLDRVLVWGDSFSTARGNVIVETQSAYGQTDPEQLAEEWRKALVSDDETAEVTETEATSVGGRDALGVDITRTNDAGVDVQQRSRLVISGDTGYSITVSTKAGDDAVLAAFEKILGTWQWAP